MHIALSNTALITGMEASAYVIPATTPESDGTLEWESTTLVLTEIHAAGQTGIGYTYGDPAIAPFIHRRLRPLIEQQDPLSIPLLWESMIRAIRNEGACGMAMMAVSAVDSALWDLKAKILNLPLACLLGEASASVQVYASGAFTSCSMNQLRIHMSDWQDKGFIQMKMKIGRDWDNDLDRVKVARETIGEHAALFVDANGAYDIRTALRLAASFVDCGVTWLEEPVPADYPERLAFIRNHSPAQINIAAGEYGYSLPYFKALLQQGAVDILQADATRCGGISGFLKAGFLAEAAGIPFSFHCAPALHLHAATALQGFYIGEYFQDHARIEHILFEGAAVPTAGKLTVDRNRPGMGIEFKHQDAAKYKI
jgi:L-alanine-DL-glutamate epimerase-like enolase superfamily enzyme